MANNIHYRLKCNAVDGHFDRCRQRWQAFRRFQGYLQSLYSIARGDVLFQRAEQSEFVKCWRPQIIGNAPDVRQRALRVRL